MNELEKYKKRFFVLTESTLGDVKPMNGIFLITKEYKETMKWAKSNGFISRYMDMSSVYDKPEENVYKIEEGASNKKELPKDGLFHLNRPSSSLYRPQSCLHLAKDQSQPNHLFYNEVQIEGFSHYKPISKRVDIDLDHLHPLQANVCSFRLALGVLIHASLSKDCCLSLH
jgi:hypothetical protein